MDLTHDERPLLTRPATSRSLARAIAFVLRPFAKVEATEAILTLLLTATVFLLLTAYYLLKTAREPLILLHGGAEVKSYAAAGQSLLLVGVVRAYAAVAQRVSRMKLIASVYLFFAANLAVFAALGSAGTGLAVSFYLWVGIFNVTAIAQFWSFAADVWSPEQGKRLFAVFGVGSSAGAVFGARIAKRLAVLGPQRLMLTAALILVVVVALFTIVDRRAASPRTRAVVEDARSEEPLTDGSPVLALVKNRYLLLAAAIAFLLNWVNTNGEYLLDRVLLEAATTQAAAAGVSRAAFVASFKADYFAWVNTVGMLLQLFVVSRVLSKVGVRAALFVLPGVALVSSLGNVVAPGLMLSVPGKIAENSVDYSLQNTARQALFLLTSRTEKFVGKTIVDTLVVRMGDVFSALAVGFGSWLALPLQAFAALNVGLIGLWLLAVMAIGREHRRRAVLEVGA